MTSDESVVQGSHTIVKSHPDEVALCNTLVRIVISAISTIEVTICCRVRRSAIAGILVSSHHQPLSNGCGTLGIANMSL